jgi:hypothetical protein
MHLCATKSYLVGAIQAHGAKHVLADWDGTDEEAIQAVMDDPRDVFALDCDNYDETGRCKGHKAGESKSAKEA